MFLTQDYILDDWCDGSHLSSNRVRKITTNGIISYIHTIKNPIGSSFAVSETETILTMDEYEKYLSKSSSGISKTRYTIFLEDNKWEFDVIHDLDIYIAEMEKIGKNWNESVILEKEIMNIPLPNIIVDVLIKEITGESEYSNKNLSITKK